MKQTVELSFLYAGYWPRHRVICLSLSMAVTASLLTALLVVYSQRDTFLYAIGDNLAHSQHVCNLFLCPLN